MQTGHQPSIHRRACLLAALGLLAFGGAEAAAPNNTPALMLANVYRPGIDPDAYWLSEKYDGVRGFWDGRRLLTRGGTEVQAPAWFTQGWPAEPMDGELWAGRGRFEETVSTVRQQTPDDEAWRRIRFMVFDLPAHPGVFSERIVAYRSLVQGMDRPWVQAVPQERVSSHEALGHRLDRMVRSGGEGLMLHRGDSLYRAVRSDDLLKVKTHEDAEAQVLGSVPGRGKYVGAMGALLVQSPDGRRFRIGSGFSDALRQQPPPTGTWVTYRYRGLHDSGLPRFATFLRIRSDADLSAPVGAQTPALR